MTSAPTPYTILLVDDDAYILEIYSIKFHERGHTVITCNSGEEALAKLKSGIHVNLIITDLVMPFMDGFDVLRSIRDEHLADDIPRIVLSNQDDTEDFKRSAALGATKHFIKIRSMPGELVELVEQMMDEWDAAHAVTNVLTP